MARKPTHERHPALLGARPVTEDGRLIARPRVMGKRVEEWDKEALESLPGYMDFTPLMRNFLLLFPTTGYNMAATAKMLGKRRDWVLRVRALNPAFDEAVELRRNAIPALISSFFYDLTGKAVLRVSEMLDKDSGIPAAQVLKAADMVFKGAGISTSDDTLPGGGNTYISADNITMTKTAAPAQNGTVGITSRVNDDDE